MREFIAILIVAAVGIAPAYAADSQRDATAAEEVAALKALADAIPLGSRVKVHIRDGRRLTATLMTVTDDSIVVKRESRVPEPAVAVRFDELARLQRDERKGGFTIGKAIGVGLAAGAGAMLTLVAILVTVDD